MNAIVRFTTLGKVLASVCGVSDIEVFFPSDARPNEYVLTRVVKNVGIDGTRPSLK